MVLCAKKKIHSLTITGVEVRSHTKNKLATCEADMKSLDRHIQNKYIKYIKKKNI